MLGDYPTLAHRNGVRLGIVGVAAAVTLACAAPAMATDYAVNIDHDDGDGGCTDESVHAA